MIHSDNPLVLARRAAMLREAADALPTSEERDRLLVQVRIFEEQMQAAKFQGLDATK